MGDKNLQTIEAYKELKCLIQDTENNDSKPDYSDGIVDLYLKNREDLEKEHCTLVYNIKKHNETEVVGDISIRFGKCGQNMFGNIGYYIESVHRGNNYTIAALHLTKKIMLEKGLTKPIITVYSNNIPSVKIIKKFGGRLLANLGPEKQNWDTYEVDLTSKRK